MSKYLMGVDIGFVNTGISLFEMRWTEDNKFYFKLKNVCLISTEKSNKKKNIRAADDDIRRINQITNEFDDFIKVNVNQDDKILVFAEAPTGGAQSAKANRAMGMATAIPAVLFELLNIPVEYVTPTEVKVAMTGKKTASKDEIMEKVIKMVGGERTIEKRIKSNSMATGTVDVYKYHIFGKKYGKNFEHIADSIGAVVHGKKHSTMYRLFVKE